MEPKGPTMEDWDIKTILLGYDGSAGGEAAAKYAGWVAGRRDAHVVVLTAFAQLSQALTNELKLASVIEDARTRADIVVKRLRAAGIKADADVLEGPAGEALVRAAEAHNVDLIVVGSRGLNPVAGLLLGSVSEYVVRRATVPVLIAR